MLTRRTWRAAALLSVVILAGCSSEPAPAPSTTRTRVWPTHDEGLRPVSMTYRDGLAYVFEETSAQALCDALSGGEWELLFGEDVVRVVDDISGGGECMVDNGSLTVRATMSSAPPVDMTGARTRDIGGHRAWFSAGTAVAEVVPQGAPSPAQPLLSLAATVMDPGIRWEDVNDKLTRLLTMLLTRLAHDGPATPVDGAFTPTSPVPGVRLSDLPRPVQALVLCTAMAATGAPNDLRTTLDGHCSADGGRRTAQVSVGGDSHGSAQFTVGGRPARFGEDGALWIDLAVSATSIARQYTQLTLGWTGADQRTVREWAGRFADQVGEL